MASLPSRIEQLEARRLETKPIERPDLLAETFPHQRAFITDPAKLKWALCTRRAAKSFSGGLDLIRETTENEGACLYIGLTRESSKRIMWRDVLKAINGKHKLGYRFNETSLVAESPNGSPIYLIGADSNEDEKQKALGQKYRKVYVDEAQAFTIDLRELVYGILKPAVADYRGTICLTGTPGNLLKGLFFDLTNGKEPGWSGHRWTTFDNPYMATQWGEEIADLTKANPLVIETPWFRQNYLGQWVIEQDKLVYRYNPDRNAFTALPEYTKGAWHYVLGVDLGYNDPTGFVVCAYHDHDRALYMLECFKDSKLDITDVANRIKAYSRRYEFDAMLVDGANKQAVEEMRRRHDLPLKAADKTGKSDFIEVMNGEFIQAQIKLHKDCGALADEYLGLIWDDRAAKREEHPNCPNHLADAALYAWRYCYAYLSEKPLPEPSEEERMENEAIMRYREANQAETEGVGDSSNWEPWYR